VAVAKAIAGVGKIQQTIGHQQSVMINKFHNSTRTFSYSEFIKLASVGIQQ